MARQSWMITHYFKQKTIGDDNSNSFISINILSHKVILFYIRLSTMQLVFSLISSHSIMTTMKTIKLSHISNFVCFALFDTNSFSVRFSWKTAIESMSFVNNKTTFSSFSVLDGQSPPQSRPCFVVLRPLQSVRDPFSLCQPGLQWECLPVPVVFCVLSTRTARKTWPASHCVCRTGISGRFSRPSGPDIGPAAGSRHSWSVWQYSLGCCDLESS